MFDLVIRDAVVVTAASETRADVAIEGGKIAQIAPPGAALRARRTIDAEGLTLLPGLVDAHVHLREPGLVHKEGFDSGTRAAAAGGVTTVMVMPTDSPITLTPGQFREKRALADGVAHVDFALQAGLGPDASHIRELTDLGAVSFEIFLSDITESLLVRDAETLLQLLSRISAAGSIAGVTPGDHDVVTRRTTEIRARSKGAAADFPGTRPPISEALGIARACVAAREAGARMHIRQVSCRAGVQALTALRHGLPISAEVTPHNLMLNEDELYRQGPIAKVAPPLRPQADVDAMRSALRDRLIDMVATDHAPHLPAEKRAGEIDVWKAPGGLPGLQTFLPAMLKLVNDGVIGLKDLVRLCATEPARLFALEHKGRIEAGADADVVLINMNESLIVRNEDQLSKAQLTPFAGLEVRGRPVLVLLRGQEIMRDGKLVESATGKFVAPRFG